MRVQTLTEALLLLTTMSGIATCLGSETFLGLQNPFLGSANPSPERPDPHVAGVTFSVATVVAVDDVLICSLPTVTGSFLRNKVLAYLPTLPCTPQPGYVCLCLCLCAYVCMCVCVSAPASYMSVRARL